MFLFLVAFIFTTGGVVYLNSLYKNIFHYDFTIATAADTAQIMDTTKTMNASIGEAQADTLKKLNPGADTLHADVLKDSLAADSVKKLVNNPAPVENQVSDNKTQTVNPSISQATAGQEQAVIPSQASNQSQMAGLSQFNTKTKPDSNYIAWMKQTAKMYESMDPKKAAKIIQSYSDNIARDIIYSMKQKKAAEILSELNPDTANRITRAKSNAF
jgi:hypothetical protein